MLNHLKKLAAEKAVEEILPGMTVGLGSGSTMQFALERISEKIKNNELNNIRCVPSSNQTEAAANRLGIPLISIDELVLEAEQKSEIKKNNHNPENINRSNSSLCIDVTIDGADECDDKLNLIKGGGGALLREKVLAQASKRLIIIVDESKISKYLGTNWHLPVEVIQFAVSLESKYLESLGAKVVQRKKTDGSNYITDENNFILDAHFGEIKNPEELSSLLNNRAGIVEHGLFIGLTSELICAMKSGEIQVFSS